MTPRSARRNKKRYALLLDALVQIQILVARADLATIWAIAENAIEKVDGRQS
jgi:hypothetical protein